MPAEDFEARLTHHLQEKEAAEAAQRLAPRRAAGGAYYENKLHIPKGDGNAAVCGALLRRGTVLGADVLLPGRAGLGLVLPLHYAPCAAT